MNTYQSVTLWHYTDDSGCDFGHLYINVADSKLKHQLRVSYQDGKKLMAQMMLRLGKFPTVTHYDDGHYRFTVYDISGFLG